jgi:hypothetical protein
MRRAHDPGADAGAPGNLDHGIGQGRIEPARARRFGGGFYHLPLKGNAGPSRAAPSFLAASSGGGRRRAAASGAFTP